MEFVFIAIIVLLLLFGGIIITLIIGSYNALIAARENIEKAWANIDVILKQRYDEVPQLVKICEQYVTSEKAVIDRAMSARERMVQGKSIKDKAVASNELTEGLKGLMAIGEAYPELKSNTNFMQIQTRLSSLEEALADRREFYNDSVNIYNVRIQSIPDVFLANFLGYKRKQMFEIKESERGLPNLTIQT